MNSSARRHAHPLTQKSYSFLNCIMGININAYGRENQRVITINLCTEIGLIIFPVILYHDVYFHKRTMFRIFYNYDKLSIYR